MKRMFSVITYRRQTLACLSAAAAVAIPLASAQDASEEEDEVFELSPFLIQADDQGWAPTETLAASRLRTNLNDVASQVEVMTLEFMDDFGMDSIEEAAIYSLNVENQDEYTPDFGGAKQTNDNSQMRIRGLSAGTRSRDFFATYASQDNYNLSRVSISSGPNAILFGTGSPAGAINSTLRRALFRDSGEFEIKFDTFGSKRFEFNVNKVLVEDKLAFFAALVDDERHWDADFGEEYSTRKYIAAMYRPTEKTSLSVHLENINIESRRPAKNLPFDEITGWFEGGTLGGGAGVYGDMHRFENDAAWISGGRPLASGQAIFNTGSGDFVLIGDSTSGVPAMNWANSVSVNSLDEAEWGDLVDQTNKSTDGITLVNDDYYPTDVNTMFNTDWEDDRSTIFNVFFNQEILRNLHFEGAFQREDYTDFASQSMFFNSSVTAKVDPNAYLPNGGENPNFGRIYFQGNSQWVEGFRDREEWRASLSYELNFEDSDNRWIEMLGSHRFAGLISELETQTMDQEFRYQVPEGFVDFTGAAVAGELISTRSYVSTDGTGSIIPEVDYLPGSVWSITDATGRIFDIDPSNAAIGDNGERLITGRNTNGSKQQLETEQFAYNGFLFGGRVVLTYGLRTDTLNSGEELEPSVLVGGVDAGSVGYIPHFSQFTFEDFDPEEEQSGDTTLKGIVIHPTKGLDLPLGSSLSFSYSESDTFQPNLSALNPDGSFQKGEEGEGEDVGVRLGLFEGKFSLRYNEYETIAGPTNLLLPFRRFRFAMRPVARDIVDLVESEADWRAHFPNWPLEDVAADPSKIWPFESGAGWDAKNFFNFGDPYAMSADSSAEGKEIQINWKPIENLDIRFTWNEQEVVQTNIATQWIDLAEQLEAIMDLPTTRFVEGRIPGLVGKTNLPNPGWLADQGRNISDPDVDFANGWDMDGQDLDPNDGLPAGLDYFTWDQIPDGNGAGRSTQTNNQLYRGGAWGSDLDRISMRERWIQNVYNGNSSIPVMQAYEGRPNDFVRQNRWNMNFMYRFTEGKFKGFRVGGGYRWREAPAIGFRPQIVNGATVPDTSVLLYGEEEKFLDLSFGYRGNAEWLGDRRYTVNLNIRNVLDDGDPVPSRRDFFTNEPLTLVRVQGRQASLSFGVEL
ncbi:MAG: hypothetical protein AAGB46_03930 [Verrucomicrobiota bacterium]